MMPRSPCGTWQDDADLEEEVWVGHPYHPYRLRGTASETVCLSHTTHPWPVLKAVRTGSPMECLGSGGRMARSTAAVGRWSSPDERCCPR